MASRDAGGPTLQSSQAEVWYLKQIVFRARQFPVINQNFNGPCSFIAICNILILRGDIQILPRTRQTVSYEFLSQLVAEYLLSSSPDIDISAALSIMPYTQKGMDLNPLFTSATTFHPSSLLGSSSSGAGAGGELALFLLTGIPLVHGWLVEPDSPAALAMLEEGAEDYDSAVGLIAEADHLTGGLLVHEVKEGEAGPSNGGHKQNGKGPGGSWTDDERRKIRNAVTIRAFLDSTPSQLTYHGLFHLASTLPSGELVALFRSSHLSVLYKDGESLVLDGLTIEDEDEDGLDYVDPEPEPVPVLLETPTILPSEVPASASNFTTDAQPSTSHPHPSEALQQPPQDPQTEPSTMPEPAPATGLPISTSTSTSTSISASRPPLPGAYSISHPDLQPPQPPQPHLHPSTPGTNSSSQLEVPGAYLSHPQLPQPQSQVRSDSDAGVRGEEGKSEPQLLPPGVSSTSSSSSGSIYSPSPPASAAALIPVPSPVPAPVSSVVSEPGPAPAPIPEHTPLTHSPSGSPSSPRSQLPIDHHEAHIHQISVHPQDSASATPILDQHQSQDPHIHAQHQHQVEHQARPPSPLTQLQHLGRATPSPPANATRSSHLAPPLLPPRILQAASQGTAATRTTQTSGTGSALYTLVTDQVFLHEPSVVWERIEDVDGADGMFVDGWFVRSSPAGGDFAGRTAEDTARDIQEAERAEAAAIAAAASGVDPISDHELARQLQAEEEQYHFARLEQEQRAREDHLGLVERQQGEERERRRWRSDSEEVRRQRGAMIVRRAEREGGQGGGEGVGRKNLKEKKEKDCVVM